MKLALTVERYFPAIGGAERVDRAPLVSTTTS